MLKRFVLTLFQAVFAVRNLWQAAWKIPLIYTAIGTLSVTSGVQLGDLTLTEALVVLPRELLVATPFVAGGIVVVTHLVQLQERLAVMAMEDHLTGLANRHAFFQHAEEALENPTDGVLIVLDADHFKQVNDRYGHAAGDACLNAVARYLSDRLDRHGVLARIGGEEFAALLPDMPVSRLSTDCRDLIGPISVSLDTPDVTLRLSLSAGAVSTRRSKEASVLLQLADEALYQAKSGGRARLVIWQPAISDARRSSGSGPDMPVAGTA